MVRARLLEGKLVNLRIVEKEDFTQIAEWINNPNFFGEYNPLMQETKTDLEKRFEQAKMFFIEKKDGTKIGFIGQPPLGSSRVEIGYALLPSERGEGYATEAAKIIVDYLFLSKDIVRVQAHTNVKNVDSQKVLEKAGFKNEGTVRKHNFVRGEWSDSYLYSILREEWKEPKILAKTVPEK